MKGNTKKGEGSGLAFLYGTALGRMLLKPLTSRAVSRLSGALMDSPLSRPLIGPFVRRCGISLDDYEAAEYRCFNDFFCRHIKPERRPIDHSPDALIAPCDGLLSAYRITGDTVLPIKQSRYAVPDLLGGDPVAQRFNDGLCLVFRLCVDNYHRYCYPDSGRKGDNFFVPGRLHTVRPIALRHRPVFIENCREYTILDTDHIGTVAMIEVGAMLVGRIVNHHGACAFERGQEKGCFQYGGSTIVMLLEPDRCEVAQAFLAATENGLETPVRMGQRIGTAIF